MGGLWSSLSSLFKKKETRLLILGLDNAGKTTILHKFQAPGSSPVQTVPTVGFNMETVQHKNVELQVWDLGGQTSIRPYWRCYYLNTSGIIYVVDSTDRERTAISKQSFDLMRAEEELVNVPIAVLANKQDMPGAMAPEEVAAALGLPEVMDRPWAIFKTSAIKDEGVQEALEWIAGAISS
eukprot:TRINITY_DN14948_c0_g6_i1.p1 TRINITY_DN14948_c0_g6~~TRINITY_DN14948_c0_g6_i1.p1  ORF type:complete len:181 (-),score=34.62 TRINITY_DN14948_c0_g6_i1:113-655(-)